MLMAMSICQGGSGFPFFGRATFDYICGKDVERLITVVEEIPDPETRQLVEEVCYIVWTIKVL